MPGKWSEEAKTAVRARRAADRAAHERRVSWVLAVGMCQLTGAPVYANSDVEFDAYRVAVARWRAAEATR